MAVKQLYLQSVSPEIAKTLQVCFLRENFEQKMLRPEYTHSRRSPSHHFFSRPFFLIYSFFILFSFQMEIHLLRGLQHNNIVQYIDHIMVDSTLNIVMESAYLSLSLSVALFPNFYLSFITHISIFFYLMLVCSLCAYVCVCVCSGTSRMARSMACCVIMAASLRNCAKFISKRPFKASCTCTNKVTHIHLLTRTHAYIHKFSLTHSHIAHASLICPFQVSSIEI